MFVISDWSACIVAVAIPKHFGAFNFTKLFIVCSLLQNCSFEVLSNQDSFKQNPDFSFDNFQQNLD